MNQVRSISDLLANLILQGNVPLKAVELAGKAISADARLCSYDQGAIVRTSLERWGAVAETYDVLAGRTLSAVGEFAQTRDAHALIQALSQIKDALTELLVSA